MNIGLAFIETSALDATNVEKSFMSVITEIYKKQTADGGQYYQGYDN